MFQTLYSTLAEAHEVFLGVTNPDVAIWLAEAWYYRLSVYGVLISNSAHF